MATLDTGRLFPETYEVWAATDAATAPDRGIYAGRAGVEALIAQQGIDGMRSSVAARLECCAIRKVAPLARRLMAPSPGSRVFAPIIARSRNLRACVVQQCHAYQGQSSVRLDARPGGRLRSRPDVPYNPLHDRGFLSIGWNPAPARPPPASPSAPGAGGGSRTIKRSAVCMSPVTGGPRRVSAP